MNCNVLLLICIIQFIICIFFFYYLDYLYDSILFIISFSIFDYKRFFSSTVQIQLLQQYSEQQQCISMFNHHLKEQVPISECKNETYDITFVSQTTYIHLFFIHIMNIVQFDCSSSNILQKDGMGISILHYSHSYLDHSLFHQLF